jgi:hypothetical protein
MGEGQGQILTRYAYERRAHKRHVYEGHAHKRHANEMHAYEEFCEDLARQNTVTHLFQLQLGFGVVAYGFLYCHI